MTHTASVDGREISFVRQWPLRGYVGKTIRIGWRMLSVLVLNSDFFCSWKKIQIYWIAIWINWPARLNASACRHRARQKICMRWLCQAMLWHSQYECDTAGSIKCIYWSIKLLGLLQYLDFPFHKYYWCLLFPSVLISFSFFFHSLFDEIMWLPPVLCN